MRRTTGGPSSPGAPWTLPPVPFVEMDMERERLEGGKGDCGKISAIRSRC